MFSTIAYEKFNRRKACSSCQGEIPIDSLVFVWRYSGSIDIYCNEACWSEPFKQVMKARYGNHIEI